MLKTVVAMAEDKILESLCRKELESIVELFCKAKRIPKVELVLVGEYKKDKYFRHDGVNGYYSPSKNRVTVRMGRKKSDMIKTLMHELTHAYQNTYHKDMLNYGMRQQKKYREIYGYQAYYLSVHEQHARVCGDELASMVRRSSNNTSLYRAFKGYSMEQRFYVLDKASFAV